MSASAPAGRVPRSLVWATDIDVLPVNRRLEQRDRYLVVRSPSNPGHHWGNLLLFADPPGPGDASEWEQWFESEFADDPRVHHRTLAWDRVDGALGHAREEFVHRGYHVEETVGLVATPDGMRNHPRENRDVVIRSLGPLPDADGDLWRQVLELQVAGRDDRFEEATHRDFCRRRLADLRALFRTGRGAWYVAVDPSGREVLASCGVVVTGSRARYQSVDTAFAHRRRGICSRLVVEAAHRIAAEHATKHFVIAADPGYHALGLYESLGFEPRERVTGVCRPPARS